MSRINEDLNNFSISTNNVEMANLAKTTIEIIKTQINNVSDFDELQYEFDLRWGYLLETDIFLFTPRKKIRRDAMKNVIENYNTDPSITYLGSVKKSFNELTLREDYHITKIYVALKTTNGEHFSSIDPVGLEFKILRTKSDHITTNALTLISKSNLISLKNNISYACAATARGIGTSLDHIQHAALSNTGQLKFLVLQIEKTVGNNWERFISNNPIMHVVIQSNKF